MADEEIPEPVADRAELLVLLSAQARRGSTAAVKALLEELRRDADDNEGAGDGFCGLDGDELSQRRKSA